jgi:uncharacterized repeat protein (TIGR01451 family)
MNLRNLFRRPLSSLTRKVAGALAVASFFTGGVLTATASGPEFNNLPTDFPTLQVAKPGQSWSTATTAQVGDMVNLFVWDHNNVPDTTAKHVTIKVDLPTAFATKHVPEASVSATNAETATGSSTINVGTESKLAYIVDSAVLYRNVGGELKPVSWPAGVNPNDIIGKGVDLGDQNGCWTYAQAVLLKVRVEGGTPAINTNKKVQLDGGAAYSDSTTAQPNDVVNYKIFMENTGNATGRDTKITDTLDSRTTYVPGSSLLKVKVNNEDKYIRMDDKDILFNGKTITWKFDDMAPRPSAAFYLQFQVRVAQKDQFSVGSTTIENCARASFSDVTKNTNCVTVIVNRSQDDVISFSLRKEVTNRTLGDSKWYDRQLASAAPGDRIAYRLIVVNTGNTTAQNVVLKDILPAGVSFEGGVKLFNKEHLNGVSISGDAIVKGGYTFAQIANGSDNYQTITFEAKTSASCSGKTLVNNSQVLYNGAVKAQDDASLICGTRGLLITKDVLNPATGQYQDSVGGFVEGDEIVFRINVQNNGTTDVIRPKLRDVLPQYTSYVRNSLTIDGEFMSDLVQNAFFADGMVLTNLKPGMGKVITFRLKATDCPPFGDTIITNRAYVTADQISELSDTATAIVSVRRPQLP